MRRVLLKAPLNLELMAPIKQGEAFARPNEKKPAPQSIKAEPGSTTERSQIGSADVHVRRPDTIMFSEGRKRRGDEGKLEG